MKVVVLAGGFGTRLGEYTQTIPKPMVEVGQQPILMHLLRHYSRYGLREFVLALGYKQKVIKDYFRDFNHEQSSFSVCLKSGERKTYEENILDWKVHLINTGADVMTGGRIARLKHLIGKETFMLTYGDGLSDVDISRLLDFHLAHGKIGTVTAVHPPARFGEIILNDEGGVNVFSEKPQTRSSWINGGFFVFEPEIFDFLGGDDCVLEREPLEALANSGELMAFRHEGFWQCMDTKRDKDRLEHLWDSGAAPWSPSL